MLIAVVCLGWYSPTAMQRQTAVTAYWKSTQLLLFVFAWLIRSCPLQAKYDDIPDEIRLIKYYFIYIIYSKIM